MNIKEKLRKNEKQDIDKLISELYSTLRFSTNQFKSIGKDKKLLAKLFDVLQVREEAELNFSISTITSNDTEYFITADEGYIKRERGYKLEQENFSISNVQGAKLLPRKFT